MMVTVLIYHQQESENCEQQDHQEDGKTASKTKHCGEFIITTIIITIITIITTTIIIIPIAIQLAGGSRLLHQLESRSPAFPARIHLTQPWINGRWALSLSSQILNKLKSFEDALYNEAKLENFTLRNPNTKNGKSWTTITSTRRTYAMDTVEAYSRRKDRTAKKNHRMNKDHILQQKITISKNRLIQI